MATKTRQRSTSKPAAAKAPPPELSADKVVGKLNEELAQLTGWNSPYKQQLLAVEELRTKLKDAESYLAQLAGAHRKLLAVCQSAEIQRLLTVKPYDAGLKECVTHVETTKSVFNNKTYKHYKKPTGAKAWSELRKKGATDAQIKVNLKHLRWSTGDYRVDTGGTTLRKGNQAITSGEKFIAEVRRVMEIPQPVGGTKAAAGETSGAKAGTKPRPSRSSARTKKPAAAAKSSAASKTPEKTAAKPVAKKSRSRKKPSKAAEPAAKPFGSFTEEQLLSMESDADAKAQGLPPLDDAASGAGDGPARIPRRDIDFGEDDDAKCEVCGCDATNACAGGCFWTEHPSGDPQRWLCSQCVGKPIPAAKGKRPGGGDAPARKRTSRSKKREAALA